MEEDLNKFIYENDCNVIDIKLHVDPQVNPDWSGVVATYFAMLIYKGGGRSHLSALRNYSLYSA